MNLLKQLVFVLLFLYHICAAYEFETFGPRSDQISLIEFYLNADVIDVSLETCLSISDEIGIITNDL